MAEREAAVVPCNQTRRDIFGEECGALDPLRQFFDSRRDLDPAHFRLLIYFDN